MSTLSRRQVEERVNELIPEGERYELGLHCKKGRGITSWKVRVDHGSGGKLYQMFDGKIMSIELVKEDTDGLHGKID